MRYLVTGGAGFIGSHLCELLIKRGDQIVILDDLSSGDYGRIKSLCNNPNVQFIKANVLDADEMEESIFDVDGIFHLAAMVSVPNSILSPFKSHMNTLASSVLILQKARDMGIKRVVSVSSSAVYGDFPDYSKREDMPVHPLSPYAVKKYPPELYTDIWTTLYGIRTVSLRLFNVFGPGQHPNLNYAAVIPSFIDQLKKNRKLTIHGDGSQTRDFIYVADVIDALILSMESNVAQGVYNIGSGCETSILKLAEIISEILQIDSDFVFTPSRVGDVHRSIADISKAVRELGFIPKISLEIGITEMISRT